jgi:DNA-directed RNA polymerase specialized sigma subunit
MTRKPWTPERLAAHHAMYQRLNGRRDRRVYQLRQEGWSLAGIGRVLGLSRQRVHQIVVGVTKRREAADSS